MYFGYGGSCGYGGYGGSCGGGGWAGGFALLIVLFILLIIIGASCWGGGFGGDGC
ncbi:YjcZ family sporulation protein (plasmid) [Bacillus cereus]|nr:YjcZ family sporulation protein [Bacillus cereus]QKH10824.1 YjcZ family sporulation protein [Bacillus cereus]